MEGQTPHSTNNLKQLKREPPLVNRNSDNSISQERLQEKAKNFALAAKFLAKSLYGDVKTVKNEIQSQN